jgi:hypothetical protein
VKGFKHIAGLGLGTRLVYVWIDRSGGARGGAMTAAGATPHPME